ncbi:MAG: ATP-binding protein [Chloroflexi bacterium]|nr:ATP-binding protein [Chloroflexota bacterium]MDA8186901.1 ATP-binding protein [Dehalococcoidales bacterium]
MKRVGEVTNRYLINVNTNTDETRAIEPPPSVEECPMCKGARHLRVDVPYGHPFFGRLLPCECLTREQDERAFTELERFSQLDPFRHKTFENFDPKVPGVDKAYNYARKFAQDPQGWFVLIGAYGSGKTHLAAAIANYALANRNQALFTVVPDLLDHLRSTFAPASDVQYDELFERVRSVPLLVLDDLGTENTTPWAGEKLYQILNYRYNEQMPTVITTNRPLGNVDDRIRSRMSDEAMCEIIQIQASDYRPKKMGERLDKRPRKPQYRR